MHSQKGDDTITGNARSVQENSSNKEENRQTNERETSSKRDKTQRNNEETLQDLLENTTTPKTQSNLTEKEKENIESALQGYNLFDKFYRDCVDSFIPLEKLEKLASEKTDVTHTERPYFMARMYSGMVESIKVVRMYTIPLPDSSLEKS